MPTDLHDPLKQLSAVLKPDERQAFMGGTLEDANYHQASVGAYFWCFI